jgi:hypothetical protein
LLTEAAVTKNGIHRVAAPPALDVKKYEGKTKNKITDEELLKILEQPTSKASSSKPKNKKKKKKPAKKVEESNNDDSYDSE